MMDSHGARPPYSVDDHFVAHAVNITGIIINLLYLIRVESENSNLVRAYAQQAEERLQAFGHLINSIPKV